MTELISVTVVALVVIVTLTRVLPAVEWLGRPSLSLAPRLLILNGTGPGQRTAWTPPIDPLHGELSREPDDDHSTQE